MAGTKAGGRKAAETNRQKYGENFYAEIGRKGGLSGNTGGFASDHELARLAGRKGGHISSRALEGKLPLEKRREMYEKFKKDGVVSETYRRHGKIMGANYEGRRYD